ncbi:MAG: cytochrome c [Chitinophagaceae bacterium]|nr:MAG: cytochrome c [Chitinophagaceae bacterium]
MRSIAAVFSVAGPYPKLNPIQPRPSSDTTGPTFPNFLDFILKDILIVSQFNTTKLVIIYETIVYGLPQDLPLLLIHTANTLFHSIYYFPRRWRGCSDLLFSDKGKEIYIARCAHCHGGDGAKGKFGAKNLMKSRLNQEELTIIINNGKKLMPSWKKRLTEEEINDVKAFIITLRK